MRNLQERLMKNYQKVVHLRHTRIKYFKSSNMNQKQDIANQLWKAERMLRVQKFERRRLYHECLSCSIPL